jgi:hypothetical protein
MSPLTGDGKTYGLQPSKTFVERRWAKADKICTTGNWDIVITFPNAVFLQLRACLACRKKLSGKAAKKN